MNCLEFHRTKLSDPRRLSAEAQAHASNCPSCAAFADSVDEIERELERSLAVPAPDGFADRVLLRARGSLYGNWRRWALAASIALALALGFLRVRESVSPADQYARLAIEHVVMEPESLTTIRNADPDAFRAVMKSFGGTLKEPLGRIRYVRLCPVEEGTGWHIVFETAEGLAILFLVPGKRLGATQTASTLGWNALAQPTRSGYYAVVTASEGATVRVERLLRERVDWNT